MLSPSLAWTSHLVVHCATSAEQVVLEGAGAFTRAGMKAQVGMLIRNLQAFSATLPGLPRTRYIAMRMLYHDVSALYN